MLNKAIAKAHRIAERFRTLNQWKPGNISARVADAKQSTGSLYVYDIIGKDWWTGDGITAAAVAQALDSLKGVKTLNVYINSEGGDVFEAKAIYTQLQRFDAQKVVHIDGIAASAATYIAMAGDKIITAPEGTWMIHEAWGGAMGEAGDLRAYADLLDMQNADIASVYSKRTGGALEDMRALMAKETWMSAAKALELKFTDEVMKEEENAEADAKAEATSKMAASAGVTQERLRLTAADRMAFITASMNAKSKDSKGRASPAISGRPASR